LGIILEGTMELSIHYNISLKLVDLGPQ